MKGKHYAALSGYERRALAYALNGFNSDRFDEINEATLAFVANRTISKLLRLFIANGFSTPWLSIATKLEVPTAHSEAKAAKTVKKSAKRRKK